MHRPVRGMSHEAQPTKVSVTVRWRRIVRSCWQVVPILAWTLALPLSLVAQDEQDRSPVTIQLQRGGEASNARHLHVFGLSKAQLQSLRSANPSDEQWGQLLGVYVSGVDSSTSPPMFGEYRVTPDRLVFEPRFPFRPGLRYRAIFDLSHLPGASAESRVEQEFQLPAEPAGPATRVTAVYPSAAVLPENQLKFYIHFSGPMRRGNGYQQFHLIDQTGREVELPFLELEQELWDPQLTRFTLLFDPGRIKRGLKPREELGPTLEEGKSYTLLIDADWRDASGRPLAAPFEKKFRVGPPDDVQPDPARWKFVPPTADSREPLTILFDEPLDEAMLQRVLAVQGNGGESVKGTIRVDRRETRWQLVPDKPWRPGRYELLVDTRLEDLAGNSIGRPFEVDIFRSVEEKVDAKVVRIPFEVPAK